MSPTSATEVSFLIVALMQGVFALLWGVAASLVNARRPLVHWAAWSALSAVTWLTLSASFESPPLWSVLIGIVGIIALERGVCLFTSRPTRDRLHIAVLVIVGIANLSLLDSQQRHWQAVVNYGALAFVYFNVARDMYGYARGTLQWRWATILAIPVSIGSLMCALRVVTALVDPASVVEVMAADSALNLRTAFLAVALSMALHSTLVGLVVARLVSELRRLSRHDALTGLLNRRAMEEALEAQMSRSQRTKEPFVVMMLDLDHFKRINDRYGHGVGDLALKHVATLLQNATRASDSLARFGGEEFVLLLPNTPLTQAQAVAEKVRDLFESSPLNVDLELIAISVSIGVAPWNESADEISHVLSRADAALFQAKVQGRNRVVTARDAAAVA